MTVDADGAETIDGGTDVSLSTQHDVVQVRSNGTQWFTIVTPSSTSTPLPRGVTTALRMSG